jgi:DNA polymerase III subunit gamma/tau
VEIYKRFRPKSLKTVVGNEQTKMALASMLRKGTLPHTILFHGPSGCGKTTLARILVSELGCHPMDFKEVNSASFRGIDTIRDVSQSMNVAPVGKCRIWLVDECHKWTNDAQNAALKMLEDTPPHVYFFLCTTDPDKLIKPIITRCCDMAVRLLTYKELELLAGKVARRAGIELSSDVMDELVGTAQGSPRTLLVLLDKIANLAPEERVAAIASKMEEENEAIELCRALLKRSKWSQVSAILRNLKGEPESVRYAVLGYARAVLLKKQDAQAALVIDCFRDNFYDSKDAGLAYACYLAVTE